jgi:Tol biopolymer transport system component
MSPEQAEGKKVDARSDIFSFGAVLYEMVTGRRPFQGDSKLSTLSAILREEPEPVSNSAPGAPSDLEKIILRCLRKDPARRFQHMDDLKVALEELKEESESGALAKEPALERAAAKTKFRKAAAAVALAAIAVVAVIGWRFLRVKSNPAPAMRIVPLVSYGDETFPALSPDGNQVAFIWNGEHQDNYDLYIKLIDGGTPLRLTTDPAVECCPAWAPDGRRLAFLRRTQSGSALFVIPALGGPERRLTELRVAGNKISWSPDGKFLAVEDRHSPGEPPGIVLVSVEAGQKRALTTPLGGEGVDLWPAFSPDGRTLAFGRGRSIFTSAVYVAPLTADYTAASEPRRLTPESYILRGLDWTADGRALVFGAAVGGGSSHLWKVSASAGAGEPERVLVEGDNTLMPSFARQGSQARMAYVKSSMDSNIYRIAGPGAKGPGRGAQEISPVKIASSSRIETSPQFSPDGSKIVFASERSGSYEIWVVKGDGSSPVQLTSFGGPMVGSPRWSPDGGHIAFDAYPEGHGDIYVISADGGVPRRLTNDKSNHVRPSWSHDGRWIYFGSDRTGSDQIWKAPAEGGDAVQVTRHGGHEAFESPDGRFLYYVERFQLAGGSPVQPIWRVPVEGGPEERVTEQGRLGYWALSRTGIYLLKPGGQDTAPSIDLFRFDTRKWTEVAKLPEGAAVGAGGSSLAVSSDERWILYVQRDRLENDLMLVENFH